MHELSIAQSIVETARGELHSHNASTLRAIGLRIGALAGVLSDSLVFCFEAITKETDLDGCILAIEHLPVVAECQDCNRTFEVDHFFFACPQCDSGAVKVKQGYELEIAYLEVEDTPTEPKFSTNGVHYAEENPT
jgi:hydrogenase nickel incorporation protein HypA/HybF